MPHLAMPNLLAGRPLLREFIQSELTPRNVVGEILRLADDSAARAAVLAGYAAVRAALGDGLAAERAASVVLGG